MVKVYLMSSLASFFVGTFNSIILQGWMGSESTVHEVEGQMGYWLGDHSGSRNNIVKRNYHSWSKEYGNKTSFAS